MTMLLSERPPFVPDEPDVMTAVVELPPGDPGTPPHRHSGPVFGYVVEGAVRYELEGEPERVLRAGESFWEPGGDLIHYQAGNASGSVPARFFVVMMGVPGEPMLTLVRPEELELRRDRRFRKG